MAEDTFLSKGADRLRAMLKTSTPVSFPNSGDIEFYVFPETVAEAIEVAELQTASDTASVADRVRYMVEVILVRAKTSDGEPMFPPGRRNFDRKEMAAKMFSGDLMDIYRQIVAADAVPADEESDNDFTVGQK